MKILMLNHNLRGDATWFRVWHFARQLRKGGHEVTIITVRRQRGWRSAASTVEGIRVLESPYVTAPHLANTGCDPWDVLWRIWMVCRVRWDLLYVFSSLTNVSIPYLIGRLFFPRRSFLSDWDDLFTFGGFLEHMNRRWITRPVYHFERWLETATKKYAHGVTVTSRYLYDLAGTVRTDGRIAYLPAGADVERIPLVDKEQACRRFALPPGRIILGYLGGAFIHGDGVHGDGDTALMLEEVALVYRELPEVLLFQIGRVDRSQPFCRTVVAQAEREGYLLLHEPIPFTEVPFFLGSADILLMPLCEVHANSRARGPIKLKDYLCAGRPIVGTALGEVETVLKQYEVGRLADLRPGAFAAAILDLIRDPVLREKCGREARRVAEQELSWDVIGQKLRSSVTMWCKNENPESASVRRCV